MSSSNHELDDHQLYARSFADVYDDWYSDLDDPSHVVAAVCGRHEPPARVLELGSGTGRLATPLHNAGFTLLALDISAPMLSTAAPGPHPVAADMTSLPLASRSVDVVVIAYNTLFNIATHELQQQCLVEAARVLAPTGSLAIEAFIAPSESTQEFGLSHRSHPTRPGDLLSIITGPHPQLVDVIIGSHVERGRQRTCRPWQLAYQSPQRLDACAGRAGLVLDARISGWNDTSFNPDGVRHVSWYKPARSDLR